MDIASYWNDVVNDLNAADHTGDPAPLNNGGPTRTSRAGAMAHLALHDGYFAVAGGPSLYMQAGPPKPAVPLSAAAAASAACYTVLNAIYPSHHAVIETKFKQAPLSGTQDEISNGFAYGLAIGKELVQRRANVRDAYFDERHPERPVYTASGAFGRHRVDPHNPSQSYLSPYWGGMRLFSCKNTNKLSSPPGYTATGLDRTDATYLEHHGEVQTLGDRAGKVRTPAETLIGIFWAYDGAQKLGTPPRLYNRIVRAAAAQYSLTEAETVRLLALVNAAMADAGIHAWHFKYLYDLWRPVVGIREIDDNFGPSGIPGLRLPPQCDPFWLPLGAPSTNAVGKVNFTPGFPAYPSGHATFGAAAFHIARLFLKAVRPAVVNVDALASGGGDNVSFSYVSEELDGVAVDGNGALRTRHNRRLKSFKQAIVENAVSRAYLGVHWRFDGTLGGYRKGSVVSARFDPTADLELGYPTAGDLIGGVPLGLNIAEDIFTNGLRETTAQFT